MWNFLSDTVHRGLEFNILLSQRAIGIMSSIPLTKPVLLLIDNQVGLDRSAPRSTPTYEENIPRLLSAFRARGYPVFHVAHHSIDPNSKLNPKTNPGGEDFYPFARPIEGEPVFVKHVNSAFIGTNLEEKLREVDVKELVVAGLTTDHCVSTSVRMAANLAITGEEGVVYLVEDATGTWGKGGWDAETVHKVHVASLDDEFASIVTTKDVVQAVENSV